MNKEKKRPRAQTYKYHKNAVCVSVYDPNGDTIPAEVRDALAESVWAIAQEHGYFINIATE